jgi:lipoyl(octanoyl) transferase
VAAAGRAAGRSANLRGVHGLIDVRVLGTVDYAEALALQERVRDEVRDGADEVLLLLEHPPVYTRGRRSVPGELPMGADWYRTRGIAIVDTQRGGKVTYHGPGQLVGYPILRVEDIAAYGQTLEEAIVAALAAEGIDGHIRDGVELTGVWVEDRKIASIGVHRSRGVTTHGFAVNVDNDLQPFEWIVPCGLGGVQMTSIRRETGVPGRLPAFRERLVAELLARLGRTATVFAE